jgi:hypothetical protein
MKKRWIMLLATVMLFAFTAGVVAAPAVQTITASLANDFKFTLNGEAWTPKDADGSTMAPIVYNDRTYLPARAIAEALGITVGWDAETRTVILGEPAAPVEEEPVEEEPVEEEPIEEEPIAPEAELAIEPTGSDYSKSAPADIPINITWGTATEITEITGSALGGAVKINPEADKHYVVDDKGDGTAVLTIKTEITKLLPVDISMVPEGTTLTLTIAFDNGDKKDFAVTVAK